MVIVLGESASTCWLIVVADVSNKREFRAILVAYVHSCSCVQGEEYLSKGCFSVMVQSPNACGLRTEKIRALKSCEIVLS